MDPADLQASMSSFQPGVDAARLTRELSAMAPPGVEAGVRPIQPGDDTFLAPEESRGAERLPPAAQRARGAARKLARELCARLGLPADTVIPRAEDGAPVWPAGILGSLSHDADAAVAIVAREGLLQGLGVDVEPPAPLPEDALSLAGTSGEWRGLPFGALSGTALFSIKEAVFKAVHPRDRIFLEFRDVIVDPASKTAATCYGRRVSWRVAVHPRILAVAWW